MKIRIGYPTIEEEVKILNILQKGNPMDELMPVVDANTILAIQQQVGEVCADELINKYIVDIIRSTRNHNDIALGISPRGSLALLKAAKAWALYKGRDYVIPDDVKLMAMPVLSHRIILKHESLLRVENSTKVLKTIIEEMHVPNGI